MSFLGKLAKMKKTHKALKNVLLTSLLGKLVKMKKILKALKNWVTYIFSCWLLQRAPGAEKEPPAATQAHEAGADDSTVPK